MLTFKVKNAPSWVAKWAPLWKDDKGLRYPDWLYLGAWPTGLVPIERQTDTYSFPDADFPGYYRILLANLNLTKQEALPPTKYGVLELPGTYTIDLSTGQFITEVEGRIEAIWFRLSTEHDLSDVPPKLKVGDELIMVTDFQNPANYEQRMTLDVLVTKPSGAIVSLSDKHLIKVPAWSNVSWSNWLTLDKAGTYQLDFVLLVEVV